MYMTKVHVLASGGVSTSEKNKNPPGLWNAIS